MGSDHTQDCPFFFSKPADAIVPSGWRGPFPVKTAELHHEVELVIALSKGGANIPASDAASMIFGFAVGIDLTRRDLQSEAKKMGRPWDMAKGFDHSAPIGALVKGLPPRTGPITLTIDGGLRQSGDVKDMIWSPAEIIAALSGYVQLAPGDLIFTGTPAGVGAVHRGQTLRATIAAAEPLEISFDY